MLYDVSNVFTMLSESYEGSVLAPLRVLNKMAVQHPHSSLVIAAQVETWVEWQWLERIASGLIFALAGSV